LLGNIGQNDEELPHGLIEKNPKSQAPNPKQYRNSKIKGQESK